MIILHVPWIPRHQAASAMMGATLAAAASPLPALAARVEEEDEGFDLRILAVPRIPSRMEGLSRKNGDFMVISISFNKDWTRFGDLLWFNGGWMGLSGDFLWRDGDLTMKYSGFVGFNLLMKNNHNDLWRIQWSFNDVLKGIWLFNGDALGFWWDFNVDSMGFNRDLTMIQWGSNEISWYSLGV